MNATLHDWHRVTRATPCVVCGKRKWCARASDGLLLCMGAGEVPTGYRLIRQNPDGGRLIGPMDDWRPPLPPPPKRKPRPRIDWTAEHAKARDQIIPGELYDFADAVLGLSGESMDLLDVGVLDDDYVFPERDARGNIVGLLRRTTDGHKLAVKGSQRGLCYQNPLPTDDPVLVVEGPSDTAAAIEAGFTVVGRPSNTGGGEHLVELLRGRDVVVLGENDRRPDGTWPGRDGAERIAAQLRPACKAVRVLYPPEQFKDFRAWMRGAE